jgi:hypothetical protein
MTVINSSEKYALVGIVVSTLADKISKRTSKQQYRLMHVGFTSKFNILV